MIEDIKLVAFDLEGVLFDWRGGLKAISEKTNISPEIIRKYILDNLINLENGTLDSISFWQKFVNEFNLKENPQEIFKIWILNQPKLKEHWDLALKYKSAGIKIAICSNSWNGLIKIFVENYPEFNIFDYIFDSSKIGFTKPQKEYFEYVEKQTGFHGNEILLIDDSEENTNCAKNFGWQIQKVS